MIEHICRKIQISETFLIGILQLIISFFIKYYKIIKVQKIYITRTHIQTHIQTHTHTHTCIYIYIISKSYFWVYVYIVLIVIIYIYIYIYVIIIIMTCRWHGYPCPSLTTFPYRSSPLAGLQGYIPYPHIAAVCMFELVVLLLFSHMWGSIGVHHLSARLCFSSSVLHSRFI